MQAREAEWRLRRCCAVSRLYLILDAIGQIAKLISDKHLNQSVERCVLLCCVMGLLWSIIPSPPPQFVSSNGIIDICPNELLDPYASWLQCLRYNCCYYLSCEHCILHRGVVAAI